MTTTVPVLPAVAAAIDERVRRRRADIEQTLASYRRSIEAELAQLSEVEAKVLQLFAVKARLEAAGLPCKVRNWSDHIEVETTKDRLVDVYRAVGRLDGRNKSVDLVNPRKRLVRVTLAAVAYPFVTVTYQTHLPAGARCRIEATKTKARTEHRLVCETA